ncbi:MAG: hypothetical protein GY950_16960 [bacterium]|nr:hypothetical protein [bacterium]
MKTLLTLDPDTERVTTKLDRASLPDLWYDEETDEFESPSIQTGWENLYQTNTTITRSFGYAFTSAPRPYINTLTVGATAYATSTTTTSIYLRTDVVNTKVNYMAIGTRV